MMVGWQILENQNVGNGKHYNNFYTKITFTHTSKVCVLIKTKVSYH